MTDKPTPQLEDGFVRFATEWLEEFIRADYPGSVKEFVFVIARETWGWNQTWREVPVPRIAELLGVSIGRVKQLREQAVGRNLVEWKPGTGPRDCGCYRVQKDYRDWIPQRVSGEWKRRHVTGKDVLTGKDALSGKDVLPRTGKDALASNRLARATPLKDSDRQLQTEQPLPPAVADGGADDLTLQPTPEPAAKATPARPDNELQQAANACLAVWGLTHDDLPEDGKLKGSYYKAIGAVAGDLEGGYEALLAWAAEQGDGSRTLRAGSKPEKSIPTAIRQEVTAKGWEEAFQARRAGVGGNSRPQQPNLSDIDRAIIEAREASDARQ